MTEYTTIQLKKTTKAKLDAKKRDDSESYDSVVDRLAAGDGVAFTDDERREIQEIARSEAESIVESYAHR